MLSDNAIHFAGYTFTTFQLLIAGLLFLSAAAILFQLRRGKRISVQRSIVTDELMIHLERIADSLDRLSGEIKAAGLFREMRSREPLPPLQTGDQPHPVSYSMFGR